MLKKVALKTVTLKTVTLKTVTLKSMASRPRLGIQTRWTDTR